MILDQVKADVAAQLDAQRKLGVQIVRLKNVPETGPVNKGVWNSIPNVTAVFADLNRSTALSASENPKDAAFAYTYFIRAMTVILDRFSAKYIDIQGDGIFGLFSGTNSNFLAAACAVTMRTQMEKEIAVRFRKDASAKRNLTAGIGIDRGTLLVRRLGLRGAKQNEVWAGKPLNMAAKLSSLADYNQVIISNRVFAQYNKASRLRRRVLLRSCGCSNGNRGKGLDAPIEQTKQLWDTQPAPQDLGFDFANLHRLKTKWCDIHGAEFCEALVTGQRRGQ